MTTTVRVAQRRRLSTSDVESQEEANLCFDTDQACVLGDLQSVHIFYQRWLAMWNSNPDTIYYRKFRCFASSVTLAAENDQPSIVHYFLRGQGLATNEDLNKSVIHIAIRVKSVQILEMMLDAELWDINEPESYCEPGAFRLVTQQRQNNEALTQWFLDHGADPNAYASVWDMTPLSYAVCYSPFSTIKLLFEHGGSAEKGQLLHYAVTRHDSDRYEIIKYLLDRGAPINHVKYENSPENYKARASLGLSTPLHQAAEDGDLDMVRFLIEHGANRTIKGSKGTTAAEEGEKYGHPEVAEFLRTPPPYSGILAGLFWR